MYEPKAKAIRDRHPFPPPGPQSLSWATQAAPLLPCCQGGILSSPSTLSSKGENSIHFLDERWWRYHGLPQGVAIGIFLDINWCHLWWLPFTSPCLTCGDWSCSVKSKLLRQGIWLGNDNTGWNLLHRRLGVSIDVCAAARGSVFCSR